MDVAKLSMNRDLAVSRFLSREAPDVLSKFIAAIPAHVIENLPVPTSC